jgi:hypothetical protein
MELLLLSLLKLKKKVSHYICIINQNDALFVLPLHVLGPFVAHHQEVARVCVENGLPTHHLEDKQIPFATHTLATS